MISPKILLLRSWTRLNDFFGKGLVISVGAIMLICLAIALTAFLFLNTAAPRVLTITTGPTGSSLQRTAERYQKILERDGVTLKIIPSDGSAENLRRLVDPKQGVDIGFVLDQERRLSQAYAMALKMVQAREMYEHETHP